MTKAPPLRDDCFVMPRGVHWTPVDEALEKLHQSLKKMKNTSIIPVNKGFGRVLAEDVLAATNHPPFANSAVDGYGFTIDTLIADNEIALELSVGRSAAGKPFIGKVLEGKALRILTGARVPTGVDTVVLEEDCSVLGDAIAFRKGLKQGANTRNAGEDVLASDVVLTAGHVLRSQDIALLAAVGVGGVSVRRRLRVAVLSTGDEVVSVGQLATQSQIYDANRPMLLSMITAMGHVPVDMGRCADDRAALSRVLDDATRNADVVITSGGASAGDEDHVSLLLTEAGAMQMWRIAIKPGRPLALGLWNNTPVFGLPGNPVAAMVCTLVFASPAMAQLAGAGWVAPVGYDVPAKFTKSKKAGRREYLRARMCDGQVEVFGSEGSGRISGLSWADGFVELAEDAQEISDGDLVRFYPYGSFGI